ncbi:MAG: DnaJ domain-containing protein [Planctomycetota bacterium]
MTPKTLKRWLIVAAVVYLLFPRDLIPDFLGRGLGLIDDLALIGGLTWFYRRQLREIAARTAREAAGGGERQERSGGRPTPPPEAERDSYATLGVPRSASQETIQAAYRARMSEYHPDKVAHLGEELQRLAHRKALEIQRAYEQLQR